MTLKQGDYPGLSRWVQYTKAFDKKRKAEENVGVMYVKKDPMAIAGVEDEEEEDHKPRNVGLLETGKCRQRKECIP